MAGNGEGYGGIYTAAQFIAAIPRSAGIISTIATRVGCDWHTAKKYIEKYPTVKAIYDDECQAILDVAETKVIGAIDGGDMGTIRWYLSTKGKDRGYAERHEVTGAEGGPILFRVVYDE